MHISVGEAVDLPTMASPTLSACRDFPDRRRAMQLKVEGMTCAHCERAVQKAVAALGGTAEVDLAAGTVRVSGTDDAAAVRRVIEEEGYKVVDAPAA